MNSNLKWIKKLITFKNNFSTTIGVYKTKYILNEKYINLVVKRVTIDTVCWAKAENKIRKEYNNKKVSVFIYKASCVYYKRHDEHFLSFETNKICIK